MITISILYIALAVQKTPVLTYHDVIVKRDRNSLWFDCTVAEFRSQIAYFETRGATFISLDQLYGALAKGKALPPRAVCLTFADNYRGFYRYAWPILRRRNIPVAQFVHTDFVGNTSSRPKMSWSELSELNRSGLVTISSQTCSHPQDLSQLSKALLTHELRDSKATLSKRLGLPIDYIAYPNGKCSIEVAKHAKSAGYKLGFTEVCKPAVAGTDLMLVPRYVHTKFKQAWQDSFGKS